MELKNYIEAGIEKAGGTATALAKLLGQNATALRNSKYHLQRLPNYACIKLAELIRVDAIEVIAASELVTEKNPEIRNVWLAFTTSEAETQNMAAQMETPPVKEALKNKVVASRGIEPRTRGFSARTALSPHQPMDSMQSIAALGQT